MLIKFLRDLFSRGAGEEVETEPHTLDDEFLKLFIVVSRSRELIERFERDIFANRDFPELHLARALEVAETIVARLEQKLSEIVDLVGKQQTSNMLHAAPLLQGKVSLPLSVKIWLETSDFLDSDDEIQLTLSECSSVLEEIFSLLSESMSGCSGHITGHITGHVAGHGTSSDSLECGGARVNDQDDALLREKANDSRRHPFIN